MNKLNVTSSISAGFYMAIQDKDVLGIYDSLDAARQRIQEEQRRDELQLVLKKKLLKKLIRSGEVRIHDYLVAEIKEVF